MPDPIQLTASTVHEAYAQIKAHFEQDGAELAQDRTNGRSAACAFRQNGNKCAVGCLIRDEDYYEGLENQGSVASMARNGFFTLEPYTPLANFLSDIQVQHDQAATVDGFLASLDSVYKRKFRDA